MHQVDVSVELSWFSLLIFYFLVHFPWLRKYIGFVYSKKKNIHWICDELCESPENYTKHGQNENIRTGNRRENSVVVAITALKKREFLWYTLKLRCTGTPIS
jgi:hypothetical protein